MTAGEKPEKEITSPAEKKEDVSPMRIYKGSAVKWICLLYTSGKYNFCT